MVGRLAGWVRELTGSAPMKSPGHTTHRWEVERLFWREIAKGLSSDDAGRACSPSLRAGTWRSRSARRSAILNGQGVGVREIARRLGRAP